MTEFIEPPPPVYVKGDKGDQGIQGVMGGPGIQGPQGDDGSPYSFISTVPTYSALPVPGELQPGFAYAVLDTGKMYLWSGNRWLDMGQWRGFQGVPGTPGVDGTDGNDGEDGRRGAPGDAVDISDWVNSRGADNLISNGSGYLRTLQNFSQFHQVYNVAPPPNAISAFEYHTQDGYVTTDELVPLVLGQEYIFWFHIKQKSSVTTSGNFKGGMAPYDSEGHPIYPINYAHLPNTTTTLAGDLNPGDMVVRLTSSANWHNGSNSNQRALIFWNYTNQHGISFLPHTYSRHTSEENAWASGAINTTTHQITLSKPWGFGTILSGTSVSNAITGDLHVYGMEGAVSTEWEKYSARFVHKTPTVATASSGRTITTLQEGPPPGTTTVKAAWALNQGSSLGSIHVVGDVLLSTTAALNLRTQEALEAAQNLAQDLADAESRINAAQGDLDQAQLDINQALADAAQAKSDALAAHGEASQASQDAADAWNQGVLAEGKAEGAQTTASTALTSANGRNSIITSTGNASGTTNPNTGLPLVKGDTWNKIDSTTTRNVIASWYYDSGWKAQLIKSEYIHNLDVHKLTATTARIQQAVIEKLVADLGYFGTIVTDELLAQQISVAIADIIEARVENLTVTEGATIANAVIMKLAAGLITTGELQTDIDATTKLMGVLDANGYSLLDMSEPEFPVVKIRLGPSGANLLQIGDASIDYQGNVTGRIGNFDDIYIAGEKVQHQPNSLPRGIVAYGRMFGGYSRQLQGRDQVIGLEADLAPGRVYRLYTNSMTVQTENASVVPFLQLHRTLDGSYPGNDWGASCVAESIIGPYGGFRTMTPMEYLIDTRDQPLDGDPQFLRAGVSLGNHLTNGWCQVATTVNRAYIAVEDLGTNFPDRGTPYYDSGGGGLQPVKERTVQRWHPTSWGTYVRGGSRETGSSRPTQGQYSSTNRECLFIFPSLTSTLAGATIHRITLHAKFDHWYGPSGTGRWHWHEHSSLPGSGQYQNFMVDTGGWARGASREINIIPSEFAAWQNGTRKGFGFATSNTGLEYYGYLSTNMNDHWIEIDLEK